MTLNHQEDFEDFEDQVIPLGIDHSFSGDFDTGLDESDSDFEDGEFEVELFMMYVIRTIFSLLFSILKEIKRRNHSLTTRNFIFRD